MKTVHVSGTRKRAIARATLRAGTGLIRINSTPLDNIQPKLARLKIREPLILAGELANKMDIDVNVYGGGVMSQADASRLAIARAIVEYSKDKKIEKRFLDYDRQLMIADVRRKETSKPNVSKARKKRQKSYR